MSLENSRVEARKHLTTRIPEAPIWLDHFDQWVNNNPDTSLVVFKWGGDIIDNPRLLASALKAVKAIRDIGFTPTIVHGGGKQISKRLQITGREPVFNNGMRVTSPDDIKTIEPALRDVNASLVESLNNTGVNAAGLNKLLTAEYIDQDEYGEVGHVTAVDTLLITE